MLKLYQVEISLPPALGGIGGGGGLEEVIRSGRKAVQKSQPRVQSQNKTLGSPEGGKEISTSDTAYAATQLSARSSNSLVL